MSPRINIEDDIECREEFWKLIELTGASRDAALGMLVRFFRLCQPKYVKGEPLMRQELERAKLDVMIESGWAVPDREGFMTIGAERQFNWLLQKKAAGECSGRRRREKAAVERDETSVERPLNGMPTEGNGIEPLTLTLSLSPSLSQKQKKEEEVISDDPSHPLIEIWKEHCGELRGIKHHSPKRLEKCKKAWKQTPDPTYWIDAVQRMARSSFLTGRTPNPRQLNWKAGFDWMLSTNKDGIENLTNVLEGAFDDRGHTENESRPRLEFA